jgi:hypothetical protein
VRASYLEIYNEDIRDLLSKSPEAKLELKESPDRSAGGQQGGERHPWCTAGSLGVGWASTRQ